MLLEIAIISLVTSLGSSFIPLSALKIAQPPATYDQPQKQQQPPSTVYEKPRISTDRDSNSNFIPNVPDFTSSIVNKPSLVYDLPSIPYNPSSNQADGSFSPVKMSVFISTMSDVPSSLYEKPLQTNPSDSIPIQVSTKPRTTVPEVAVTNIEQPSSVYDLPAVPSSPGSTELRTMPEMPYDFSWEANDSNEAFSHSHKQSSDGHTMKGEYRVLLPDGRMQIVTFFDDGNGMNMKVTYE